MTNAADIRFEDNKNTNDAVRIVDRNGIPRPRRRPHQGPQWHRHQDVMKSRRTSPIVIAIRKKWQHQQRRASQRTVRTAAATTPRPRPP